MFLDGLLYRQRPSVWEWSQSELYLPHETSPNAPGRLSFAGQEYLREPLECLRDDAITHIMLCFGAQVAKTTLDLVAYAYMRTFDPQPGLWSLSTRDLAKDFVRERFEPFCRANKLPLEGINFVGVNNPGELAMRPCGWVVMDEAAKYQHLVKAEATPDKLIEKRTNAFTRKKIIISSTPSTEGHPFWQRFIQTDMRHYFVPCPHCGERFELRITRKSLVWEQREDGTKVDLDTVRRTAHYVCPHCGSALWERDKASMMAAGEWRSTNTTADSKVRGYHLNALYSRWLTWGDVAVEFVQAARANELQDFVNSYQAEPYVVYHVRVREDAVETLRSQEYMRGQVPPGTRYLTCCYDVHNDKQYWVVCAMGDEGEQWVVDWGTLLAVEEIPEHFDSLSYEGHTCTLGFIDSGYAALKVYDACARSGGKLWPSKGSDARFGTFSESRIPSHPMLGLTVYSDHQAKNALYGDRIAGGKRPALHVPRDADEALMAGLSGQELARRNNARFATWKKVAGDHYGDCVKLCALTWAVAGAAIVAAQCAPLEVSDKKQI